MTPKQRRAQTIRLAKAAPEVRRRIIARMSWQDVLEFDADYERWISDGQCEPSVDGWRTWLMMAGRGFGKTRAGAEWIHALANARRGVRIALVGATIGDARSVMVEGVSGLIAVARRYNVRLQWEPSLGRLCWPNGSQATLFSGDNADGLRGPEHDFAWVLTFEVIADELPPSVDAIVSDASGGLVQSAYQTLVTGYALHGSNVALAMSPLIEAFGLRLFDDGTHLRAAQATAPLVVTNEMLGHGADGEAAARIEIAHESATLLPTVLRLAYYDASAKYQLAEARASVSDQPGGERRHELPAVIDGGLAKAIAGDVLARRWAEREMLTLRLPQWCMGLEPGATVEVEARPGILWRVERCTIDRFVVITELRAHRPPIAAQASPSGPAIALATMDVADEGTVEGLTLALFEVPAIDGRTQTGPSLLLAASSAEAEWRAPMARLEIGGQSVGIAAARRRSILGRLQGAATADPSGSIDIQLIDPSQWLTSCDAEALACEVNLAILGGELIQFADALPLGDGGFRLSGLVRGVAGSEACAHSEGEMFALAQAGTLRTIPLPAWSIGRTAVVHARTPSGQEASAAKVVAGPQPVALVGRTVEIEGQQVVGARQPAISSPAGGGTEDFEARRALSGVLESLRRHGLIES